MFVKSDPKKEKNIIEDLISNDEELRKQHEIFIEAMSSKPEYIVDEGEK